MLDILSLTLVMAATQATTPGPPPNVPSTRAVPDAPGTSVIRGHVAAADTGQAMRKAQVRLTSPDLRIRLNRPHPPLTAVFPSPITSHEK